MFEELEKDWQRLRAEDQPPSEDLIGDVRKRAKRLSRQLLFRDLREIVAAALVMGWFAYIALTTESRLAIAGSLVIIVHAVVVSAILLAGRRVGGPARPADPPATEFRRRLQNTEAQITLLRRVLWWYILPGDVGVLLILFGLSETTWVLALMMLALAIFSAWVWWINQRAAERDLIPWRDHLKTVIQQLEEHGPTHNP